MSWFNYDFFFTWIWDSSKCNQFIQQYTKGPDVRLDAEFTVKCSLWRSPFDGKFRV